MSTKASPKPQMKLFPGTLNGELVIKIHFGYNKEIIEIIKTIPGRIWNQESRYWYIPKRYFNMSLILSRLSPLVKLDYSSLENIDESTFYQPKTDTTPTSGKKNTIQKSLDSRKLQDVEVTPQYLEKLIRKRYSPNTIKTYMSYMRSFVAEFHDRNLESITTKQINDYILNLIRTKNISPSQQNQRINAIKFYYEKVLGRKKKYYHLSRPRREKKLPNVLLIEEVELILNNVRISNTSAF